MATKISDEEALVMFESGEGFDIANARDQSDTAEIRAAVRLREAADALVDNAIRKSRELRALGGMRLTMSATRHGVVEADIRHVLNNYVRAYKEQGMAELSMLVGPARDGSMLEVGVVNDPEDPRVIHAMAVRRKYWP